MRAKARKLSGKELSTKLSNANKLKVLSFDNTTVINLDDRYVIDKLRVMHFVNCNMKVIESTKVFE